MAGFSLDLDPRLLFGAGLPTALMREAEMDKYLEFIPVQNLFILRHRQEHLVPFAKGDIFKSGLLTLAEKKQLYGSLQVVHQLGRRLARTQDDPNSLNEFNKQITLSEEWLCRLEAIRDSPCQVLFDHLQVTAKVRDLYYYVLAGYQANPEGRHSVSDFLLRTSRFIESCWVYGKTPYLMIAYGAADLAQAYSRVASVYGATFLLSPSAKVHSVECQDGQFSLATSLNESPLTCRKLIAGSEFCVPLKEGEARPAVSGKSAITIIVG